MCVYGGGAVPQGGVGDRRLVTVPQGVVGDRLPWGGERQGGARVLGFCPVGVVQGDGGGMQTSQSQFSLSSLMSYVVVGITEWGVLVLDVLSFLFFLTMDLVWLGCVLTGTWLGLLG